MNPKNAVSTALLLFVGASIVVLAAKSLRPQAEAEARQEAVAAALEASAPTDGIVAYYFYSNTRCPTCQRIESHAHEALTTGFPAAMQEGRIQWRTLNYERLENMGHARRYQIAMPMVVLASLENGAEKDWKRLDRVWEFTGDREAMIAYVQAETQTMLTAPDAPGSLENNR
jgi:hypothetical protein